MREVKVWKQTERSEGSPLRLRQDEEQRLAEGLAHCVTTERWRFQKSVMVASEIPGWGGEGVRKGADGADEELWWDSGEAG